MKTIFFDNDGTLVDTEKLYFKATKLILNKVGIEMTREWFIEQSLKKNQSSWSLIEHLNLSNSALQSLIDTRNDYYSKLLESKAQLLPEVKDTLNKLYGHVQMAVVTTSRRKHFEIILERTGISNFFDFFVVNEDVINEKPDPEPYLLALSKSGNKPDNCIAIEDTERGLISSVKAGIPCYAIPTELSKNHDFSKAAGILKSFSSILELPLISSQIRGVDRSSSAKH